MVRKPGHITCDNGIIMVSRENDRRILTLKVADDFVRLRTVSDNVTQAEKGIVLGEL